MNLSCQASALHSLMMYSNSRIHSVLIEGSQGCGKTYLSGQYAKMLGISDVVSISPDVSSIRDMIQSCYDLKNDVLVCIENLDCGVPGASYTLLKFLEEPSENVYIVVTCRNMYKVPDTILSRCGCVSVSHPTREDLNQYFQEIDPSKLEMFRSSRFLQACSTFSDINMLCKLSLECQEHLINLMSNDFKDSISSLSWSFTKYPDGSDIDVLYMLRLLRIATKSNVIKRSSMRCAEDVSSGRVAKNAAVSRLLFDCKYLEG